MAKFTYTGVDGAADPKGTLQFGTWFPVGKAIEVENPRAIEKLAGHPHFKGSDKEAKEAEHEAGSGPSNERAREAGAKAKADGKDRSVPVAYRSEPEGAAWIAGYDGTGEAA